MAAAPVLGHPLLQQRLCEPTAIPCGCYFAAVGESVQLTSAFIGGIELGPPHKYVYNQPFINGSMSVDDNGCGCLRAVIANALKISRTHGIPAA